MTEAPKRLWVPGQPASQPRPRLSRTGGTYVPDTGWQGQVYAAWYEAHGAKPFDGPVSVSLEFVLVGETGVKIEVRPIPLFQGRFYHQGRTDVDRLAAAVLDALGGHVLGGKRLPPLAYNDDIHVVSLYAQKIKGGTT